MASKEGKEAKLSAWYGDLKKAIDNGNNTRVVKCANKIIAEAPDEVKAWQCKVVAQIQMDQFSDALTTAAKCTHPGLEFERAYCEYRLNKVSDALDTISKADLSQPHIQELHAQILYRLEKFDECYDVYRAMIRTTSDDFDQERLTNMAAVAVNRSFEGTVDSSVSIDESSYELLYNGGCHLMAEGDLEGALKKLKAAEAMCRTFLLEEEGATEEEVQDEVAIIRVQQGYCLQQMGQEKEAMTMYNDVLKGKPEDPALLAIINNNLVTLNRAGNVFDSRKKMKGAMGPQLQHKLTSLQRGTIAYNSCLLAYNTNQDDVCRAEAERLENEYPQLSKKAGLLQAAMLGRDGRLQEARQLLHQNSTTNDALEIALIETHILLSKGDMKSASEILLGLDENSQYRMGIVSTLVSMYLALGNSEGAAGILRKAVEWHQKNKTSRANLTELWRHAADFHLRGGDAQTAAASLLELHKTNPKDVKTLAQLITAYAQFDVGEAQRLSRQLPPASSVVQGVDGDALEAALGHRYVKKLQQGKGDMSPASPSSPKAPVTPGIELKKTKKKKKKKTKLPKNYNPNIPPDPERWLPRWQRKLARKRRDRRQAKEVMKGTQGVTSDAADKFDATKTSFGHKPLAAASPKTETYAPRRNFQKKKATGGKKKKGGK